MTQHIACIESVDRQGWGITHHDGKTIFVDGGLPGEIVSYCPYRRKTHVEYAQVTTHLKYSFMRVSPQCPHALYCGGCSLQHMEHSAQVAIKQRVLEDCLQHIGNTRAMQLLAPVYGLNWAYRHRARLSVRYVHKRQSVLVGFHEKHSRFIADLSHCVVLAEPIGQLLLPLRALINKLSVREHLPQIEVAIGDKVNVFVLRLLQPLSHSDETEICNFADDYQVQFWLQPQGPDSAYPFYPLNAPPLSYSLPEFALEMQFGPTEFTQVNPQLNRILVQRALSLLSPQPGELIADMFCGLGNFSLPLARCAAKVIGIEGQPALVARAKQNAANHQLSHYCQFDTMDLFKISAQSLAALGGIDKMLIDPPRDGAIELIKALAAQGNPKRIVYVSCHPATLARDSNVLTHVKGYRLVAAGIINMFAHTRHVESIACFER